MKEQNMSTEMLKSKREELLTLKSICEAYLNSVNGSLLGTLSMTTELNLCIKKLNRIDEELIARNEFGN